MTVAKRGVDMTSNINMKTGVPFGVVSAKSLDQDVVSDLYSVAENISMKNAMEEWKKHEPDMSDQDFYDQYEEYEDTYEGTHKGVSFIIFYLGGAPLVMITESPEITENAQECSPCVPNAGDLDNMDGEYRCYDVPAKWRREE